MEDEKAVCVLGAGAVGGLLGSAFAARGHKVTYVDREPRLDELRKNGLEVVNLDGKRRVDRNSRFEHPDDVAGQFDIALLAVKAHQICELTDCLKRIVAGETVLLTLQNGLPWWYFQGIESHLAGTSLKSLDPDGSIAAAIPEGSIIGTVVYPAAEIQADGSVKHVEGDRFVLGELRGGVSDRINSIADLISDTGLRGQVNADIRAELWLKAWGSLAFNPVSALTRSTMAGICRDSATRSLVTELMREAEAVANAVGVEMRVPLDRRLQGAERVGEHKTSMLQDIEAGRQTEVEAVIGSVLEVAELAGVDAPRIASVYALIRRLNEQLGQAS